MGWGDRGVRFGRWATTCAKCGSEVAIAEDNYWTCPNCGKLGDPVPESWRVPKESKESPWRDAIAFLIGVIIVITLFVLYNLAADAGQVPCGIQWTLGGPPVGDTVPGGNPCY